MNRQRVLLVLSILAPVFLLGFVSAWRKEGELRRLLSDARQEASVIERSNTKLRDLVQYFSLRANVEREAKKRLNLAKPGERVVIFISPSPVSVLPSPDVPLVRFWKWFRFWDE